MKHLFTFCIALCTSLLFSQNCTVTSVGYVPIMDLGTNISPVTGSMGGLYPGGTNIMPASHRAAGLSLSSQVACLDAGGNVDAVNGKIVWLSIGLSNTTQETQQFIPLANAYSGKNPKLKLVDGALGSHPARSISTVSDIKYIPYWDTVAARLVNAGVTAQQVQVIWLKQANSVGGQSVPDYYDSLVVQLKRITNELRSRFPNIKLCYLSSRIYAGYATSNLNPEPYSYWTGWADKKVIEDQINGDPQLVYNGASPKSPWIAWGPDLWADGTTPRSDGLVWNCSEFQTSDGTHPNLAGEQKVAQKLLNFFISDTTTKNWFLGTGCSFTGIAENNISELIKISPNPSNGNFTIQFSEEISSMGKIEIYNAIGQKVYDLNKDKVGERKIISFHTEELDKGMYFVKITDGSKNYFSKFIIN